MNENFKQEEKYLSKTISKIIDISAYTKKRIDSLPSFYKDNPFQLADLTYQMELKLKLLNNAKEKPYFARIDFEDESKKNHICYIGKVGISDDDNNLVTIDWRAPIASIYYDSNIGPTKYVSPKGIIEGTLLTKRQFDIEKGKLNGFQDVDTVSNDEMLKPYLNASADNRLKNIVSTIQLEQNEIIREKLNENLIIQGVAGSGKTTVALHRVAYLVYNNIDNIKPEDYLVIGPNKFFVNYISGVLPDLDVNGVCQLTYDELVKKALGIEFTLLSDENKIKEYLKNNNNELSKYKTSIKFKNIIDNYIDEYNDNLFPDKDLVYLGYKILSKEKMQTIYSELEINSEVLSINMYKFYQRFARYIEEHKSLIQYNIREEYTIKGENKPDTLRKVINEVNNKCSTIIKNYYSKTKPTLIKIYTDILEREKIDKKNINNIKKKLIDFEDLPALLYLHYRFYGNDEFNHFRHTVIDEAQDFGEFSFYALNKLLNKSTFSIFGDLAQSIFEYRSVDSWKEVLPLYNNVNIKYLKKSYRTTTEIMDEANKIIHNLDYNKAEPVIRHGKNVNYIKTSNKLKSILDTVHNYKNENYKTIAVICKDDIETNLVYEYLCDNKIKCNMIANNDNSYKGGICVINSYLVKGLEFDGVIISDASSNIYNENKKIEMKLLYVAMTRALHELTILYENNLVSYLTN